MARPEAGGRGACRYISLPDKKSALVSTSTLIPQIVSPSSIPVRFVGVILGRGVESDMQPVDAKAGRTDPDRLCTELPLENRADHCPQLMLLVVGRLTRERGKLRVSG